VSKIWPSAVITQGVPRGGVSNRRTKSLCAAGTLSGVKAGSNPVADGNSRPARSVNAHKPPPPRTSTFGSIPSTPKLTNLQRAHAQSLVTPRTVWDDLPLDPPLLPAPEPDYEHARWQVGKLSLRADFDSANLAKVQAGAHDMDLELWTRHDNEGTDFQTGHRTWFYFGVTGYSKGDVVHFAMMNLNRQGKLYGNDMRPFFRIHPAMNRWERSQNAVSYNTVDDGNFQMRFKHEFKVEGGECFFAFCQPWSLADHEVLMKRVEETLEQSKKSNIYLHRSTLTHSLQGRPVEVITLTGADPRTLSGLEAEPDLALDDLFSEATSTMPLHFPDKKVIVISSRVHPGETPAAHMFNGMLAFLLRQNDERALAMRRMFVFKLLPNLNPDGVFHGHYRTDTRGANLNRCYENPTLEHHPTIRAAKALVTHYAETSTLDVYIDLHAHANKRGCFLFGNNINNTTQQIENVLLAKLASLNSPYFDFNGCDFSERNMHARDRNEPTASKDGCGRVALYHATNITHIYTCESNYNTARILNTVAPIRERDDKELQRIMRATSPPSKAREPVKFCVDMFASMGRCLLIAILDMRDANPWSRIPNTEFKSVAGCRTWVGACLRAQNSKREARITARTRGGDEDDEE